MATYPVKTKRRALQKSPDDDVAIGQHQRSSHFTFRYSCTEVSLVNDRTHVKSRQVRFEDDKLTSEAFEGELHRSAYGQVVNQAQRQFWKSLSLFLPFRD